VVARTSETVKHAATVNKLLAKAVSTESASEAHALRAKAYEYTMRFGIDQALLDATSDTSEIVSKNIEIESGPYVEARSKLLTCLTRHLSCEVLWDSDRLSRVFTLIWFRTDVVMVAGLFAELDRDAALASLHADLTGNKLSARRAFLFGFADGVDTQMDTARTSQLAGDNHAALVLAERAKVVAYHLNATYTFRQARSVNVDTNRAFRAGRHAGEQAA
jgi:hypothetical protein